MSLRIFCVHLPNVLFSLKNVLVSLYSFFVAIKKALGSRDAPGLPCNSPEELLLSLANLCEDHMGGSSGVVSYLVPSMITSLFK